MTAPAVDKGALRHYALAGILSAITLGLVVVSEGPRALLPVLALAVLEVTFSFDNAVMNSRVLTRMSRFWRRMFLTVGIAVAVFGVRLLLPIAIVAASSRRSVGYVVDLALHHPARYAQDLTAAYPMLAAFGGVFLWMIGLRFLATARPVRWIAPIEATLSSLRRPWWIALGGAAVALAVIALVLAPHQPRVLVSAALGAVTFILLRLLSDRLAPKPGEERPSGAALRAGAVQFFYLELLDASFSIDGVIAAFAITKEVLLIAAGLGIGAVFVRSMTTHLLENGTLREYRYLEHGAHYAIAALAVMMLVELRVEIPSVVAGSVGVALIAAAWVSSVRFRRREEAARAPA